MRCFRLPNDCIQLARSDICEIEAMKHKNRPLYGVQWHPEVVQTKSGESLFMNFFKVCEDCKI